MSIDSLKNLGNVLRSLDHELRQKTICPTCGKPASGIVPAGQSPAQAGLCTGHPAQQPEPEN